MLDPKGTLSDLSNAAEQALCEARPVGISLATCKSGVLRLWLQQEYEGRSLWQTLKLWLVMWLITVLAACSGPAPTTDSSAGGATKALDSQTPPGANPEQSAASGGESAAFAGAGGLPAAGGTGGGELVTAGAPEPSAGAGGAPTAGAGGGSAGQAPEAGAGGSAPTCKPLAWAKACEGRNCGKVDDGCGHELGCGSCTGLTECTDAGQCATTCSTLGLECGPVTVVDDLGQRELDCGECDAGDCGVVGIGQCSTCEMIGPNAKLCPVAGSKLWRDCSTSPAAQCAKASALVQGAPSTAWCCL